jgi:hypothetical protein
MDLLFNFEVQPGLLLVTVSGKIDVESAVQLLKRACDTAVENKVNKILINNLAVEAELDTFQRYRLAAEIAPYFKKHLANLKLAIVGQPPATDGFAVRVGQNRGVVAEVFPSRQAALNWLRRWPD